MTELLLKAAIKAWGNEAKVAAEAEMKQLHWRNTFKPVHWKDLTPHRRIKRYQRAYHVDQILPVPWNSYGYTVSLDRFPYG